MKLLRKKKSIREFHHPIKESYPKITSWEEGRKWLKEHKWRLRYHCDCQIDKDSVTLHIDKENACDIEIRTDAPTDLMALQKIIKRAKEIDESRK